MNHENPTHSEEEHSAYAYEAPEGTVAEQAATLCPREIHEELERKLNYYYLNTDKLAKELGFDSFYTWQAKAHQQGKDTRVFEGFAYPRYQEKEEAQVEDAIFSKLIEEIGKLSATTQEGEQPFYGEDFLRLARAELRKMMAKKPSGKIDSGIVHCTWALINQRIAIIFNNVENRIKGITTVVEKKQ